MPSLYISFKVHRSPALPLPFLLRDHHKAQGRREGGTITSGPHDEYSYMYFTGNGHIYAYTQKNAATRGGYVAITTIMILLTAAVGAHP